MDDIADGRDPQPIVEHVTAALADLNDCTPDDRANAIAAIRAELAKYE
jgi:hypothetical protein